MNDNLVFQKLLEKILADSELLKMCPLKMQDWKETHLEYFAEIITSRIVSSTLLSAQERDKIGTTISVPTLKRLLKFNTIPPRIKDKRQINSLCKLSIFAGFKSWHNFKYNIAIPKAENESDNILEFKEKIKESINEVLVIIPSLIEFEKQLKTYFNDYELDITWGIDIPSSCIKESDYPILEYYGGGNLREGLVYIHGEKTINNITCVTHFVDFACFNQNLDNLIDKIFTIRANFNVPKHIKLAGIFCATNDYRVGASRAFPNDNWPCYNSKIDTELYLLYAIEK